MGDMLEKVLKSVAVSDPDFLSSLMTSRNTATSPLPSASSSIESDSQPDEQNW